MDLIIKKIEVKNYNSIGNKPITLEYEPGFNAVVGKVIGRETNNGVGKSTLMVDALTFGLYGKSPRGVNINNIVNAINKSDCVVKLWFSINNNEYMIERGIKPGYTKLFVNGNEEELGAKVKTQEKINNIIGISYDTFINLITLNINVSIPFFNMTASEKRSLLEDIMNMSIYGRMFDIVKKDYNTTKSDIRLLENDVSHIKETFQSKVDTFKKISEKQKTFETTKQIKITELTNKLTTFEETLKSLSNSYVDEDYKSKIDEIKEKISHITGDIRLNKQTISNNESSIDKKTRNVKRLTDNPTCLECGTPTTSDTIVTKIQEIQNEIDDLSNNNKQLKILNEKYSNEIDSLSSKMDEYKSMMNKIVKIKESIQETKHNIKSIKEKIQEVELSSFDMSEVINKDDIVKYKQKYTLKKTELSDLEISQKYNEVLKECLSDKGIKNYILSKCIPILNKKINHYLQVMNAHYKLTFDNDLNETIKSRRRDEFTYKSFSAGEKKRIDIALMLALLDIARSRSSIKCNILILDEVLDSSMCEHGITSLINYFKTDFKKQYPTICTYVITHKSEIKEDNFDSIIYLHNKEYFTQLYEIKRINPVIQI